MYEVFTEKNFCGAHRLRNYNGACENLHGHNWEVRVTVRSETLNDIGLAIDFKVVKKNLNVILDRLDHTDLNDTFTEEVGNPSAENLAKHIFDELKISIAKEDGDAFMYRVDIWETPGNCASYFEHA